MNKEAAGVSRGVARNSPAAFLDIRMIKSMASVFLTAQLQRLDNEIINNPLFFW